MLVLSRKLGEKIHIGVGITVTVLEVNHRNVRLGIDAPKDVRIMRAELDAAMARGNVEVTDAALAFGTLDKQLMPPKPSVLTPGRHRVWASFS